VKVDNIYLYYYNIKILKIIDYLQKRVGGPMNSRVQVTHSASRSANHQRSMLKNYKELKVWQKSYQLCLEIYSELQRHIEEVERMLKSLIKSL